MKWFIRLLILFSFCIGFDAFAQSDSLRFSVRGTVRDAETGKVGRTLREQKIDQKTAAFRLIQKTQLLIVDKFCLL